MLSEAEIRKIENRLISSSDDKVAVAALQARALQNLAESILPEYHINPLWGIAHALNAIADR